MTSVPETHFCHGCIHGVTNQCMSKQSPFRRMNIARKRVTRCRFKRLKVVDVPGTVPKEKEPETIGPEDEENVDVTEPWPEKEAAPLEDDLTKIVETSEEATKEPEDEEKATEAPKDPEPEEEEEADIEPPLKDQEEQGPLPGDPVIDPGDIKFIDEIEEEEETKEDPKEGESLTQLAINESIHNDIKERLKEGERIAKSMLTKNQPLAHVESEDGSSAAGPTPPIKEDEPKEEKKESGPTGITLHPKGEPDDGDNGPIEEQGRKFLEDAVNDIEGKSELPVNGLLKLETKNQPALASECCSDVLNILEKADEVTEGPVGSDIDPDVIFKGLEEPPLKDGAELDNLYTENKINSSIDLMFCFNCQREHPIGYFSPEGNICLNCVQIELRRVLAEIRQKFFDPSAADHELLDEVLKEEAKDGKRLSMLETLYIARDLLQSYSPLARKEAMQIQPAKEEVPAMSSPFLITCDEMEPRVQQLTWAQLQKIARKMDVPLNQPIDWIAAQVCARVKRCNKCDQLKLSKA